MELDHVIGVVSVLHPLCFGGVLFLKVGIIDGTEIIRGSIDGGCVSRTSVKEVNARFLR